MRANRHTRLGKSLCMLRSGFILPLFALMLLVLPGAGCAAFTEAVQGKKPEPEIMVQTADYGTVTQVTTAATKDREIHLGDIAITVDTDDGGVVIVVQPEDDIYKVGDRVRIVRDGQGFVRVQLVI